MSRCGQKCVKHLVLRFKCLRAVLSAWVQSVHIVICRNESQAGLG